MATLQSPLNVRLKRLLRRARLGPPVIVVSGLPRSGTSMMMRMLEQGGLELLKDEVRGADQDNPRGYFEFEPVKDLAGRTDKAWVKKARGKAVKVISELLRELPRGFFYRVVFLQRPLREVIASQNKMLQRSGTEADPAGNERLAMLFERHLRATRLWLRRQPNFEVFEVDYRSVIENPRQEAEKLTAFLKLPLRVDSMVAAVEPGLYRNRFSS